MGMTVTPSILLSMEFLFITLLAMAVTLPSQISSTSATKFKCPTVDTAAYPDPQDCGSYYVCIDFVPHLMHCPSDLYYNPTLGVCDYKVNVDCTVSTTPSIPTGKPITTNNQTPVPTSDLTTKTTTKPTTTTKTTTISSTTTSRSR